ncbi:MAG: hypothetical protein IKF51_02555, partial [Solobacterium sp.]|nr:hypothetical protein [Solobacterium sp.]
MKNTLKKLNLFLCSTLILGLSAAFIVLPERTFSENENRILAEKPELTVKNIFSGSFDTTFETWFTDHFPLRDQWIELKAFSKKTTGSLENNDVYFAEDGYLIRRFQTYEERTLVQNLEMIKEFCDTHEVTPNVLLVKTAAWTRRDLLKSGSFSLDQDALCDHIEDISGLELIPFDTEADPFYFRTDHHWNAYGAYQGYKAICEHVLHKEPEPFTMNVVSHSFRGTMYSRSGAFWHTGEDIIQPVKEGMQASVTLEDGTVHPGLFFEERLQEKDQYMYYLDGNHAFEHIET